MIEAFPSTTVVDEKPQSFMQALLHCNAIFMSIKPFFPINIHQQFSLCFGKINYMAQKQLKETEKPNQAPGHFIKG